MVSLGRPGAGEKLLESCGFINVERIDVPFAWEFADPECYAALWLRRARRTKPYRTSANKLFTVRPSKQARQQVRDGVPLRAEIKVVGYLGRKPEGAN